MKAIIVDDVLLDIEAIRTIVQVECPEVQIVGTATTLREAERLINTQQPELVFLDIQMDRDGSTSFQLLEKLGKANINFEIIFITAYGTADNQTKAIQFSSLDFILKPVDGTRLKAAIEKAKERKGSGTYRQQVELFMQLLREADKSNTQIMIDLRNSKDRVSGRIIAVADIIKCEAEGQDTHIYLNSEKIPLNANKHLGFYENLLTEHNFFRVHDKTLLNLKYVKGYDKKEKTLSLQTGRGIVVSRRRWDDVIKKLPNVNKGGGLMDFINQILGKDK